MLERNVGDEDPTEIIKDYTDKQEGKEGLIGTTPGEKNTNNF